MNHLLTSSPSFPTIRNDNFHSLAVHHIVSSGPQGLSLHNKLTIVEHQTVHVELNNKHNWDTPSSRSRKAPTNTKGPCNRTRYLWCHHRGSGVVLVSCSWPLSKCHHWREPSAHATMERRAFVDDSEHVRGPNNLCCVQCPVQLRKPYYKHILQLISTNRGPNKKCFGSLTAKNDLRIKRKSNKPTISSEKWHLR